MPLNIMPVLMAVCLINRLIDALGILEQHAQSHTHAYSHSSLHGLARDHVTIALAPTNPPTRRQACEGGGSCPIPGRLPGRPPNSGASARACCEPAAGGRGRASMRLIVRGMTKSGGQNPNPPSSSLVRWFADRRSVGMRRRLGSSSRRRWTAGDDGGRFHPRPVHYWTHVWRHATPRFARQDPLTADWAEPTGWR